MLWSRHVLKCLLPSTLSKERNIFALYIKLPVRREVLFSVGLLKLIVTQCLTNLAEIFQISHHYNRFICVTLSHFAELEPNFKNGLQEIYQKLFILCAIR